MKKENDLLSQLREPGIAVYFVLAMTALAGVLLLQQARGLGLLGLLLFCVGLLGVVARLQLGPILYLGILAVSELSQQATWGGLGWRGFFPQLIDPLLILQTGATLIYLGASYRLLGLTANLLPLDMRVKEETAAPVPTPYARRPVRRPRRTARLVTVLEFLLLLLGAPLWAVLGQLAWSTLALPWPVAGLPPQLGRLILLVWVLVLLILPPLALLTYWRRRQYTRAEAEQVLQDALWRDLRREQRRAARLLAADRLRRQDRGIPT